MGSGTSILGKAIYWMIFSFFFIVFKLFYGLKVTGKENIPDNGPFMIISNHQHFLDPTLVGVVMYPHQVHFMAKEELFKNLFFRWIFLSIGTFPVRRGRPDRRAIAIAVNKLKNGNVICMFPEGTRQRAGVSGRAKGGIVQIVKKTGVKVLPVFIDLNGWKRPIKVAIGKTFSVDGLEGELTREEIQRQAEAMMDKVRSLA